MFTYYINLEGGAIPIQIKGGAIPIQLKGAKIQIFAQILEFEHTPFKISYFLCKILHSFHSNLQLADIKKTY